MQLSSIAQKVTDFHYLAFWIRLRLCAFLISNWCYIVVVTNTYKWGGAAGGGAAGGGAAFNITFHSENGYKGIVVQYK